MNKDDILIIVKYPYSIKSDKVNQLHDNILKQKETGVIVIPDCCEVVIAPKDVEIKMEKHEYTNEELAEAFCNGRGG